MPPDDARLAILAAAVLDGTGVDWPEEDSDPRLTPTYVDNLKLVAAIADIHRIVSPLSPAPKTPQRWGHLRLLGLIGRGAFGDVYRAWDTRLDREVALKLLAPEPEPGTSPTPLVIHEGQLLARVKHPNVVTIYGAERIDDRIGLWMEFVRGRTLEQVLADGPFTAGETARIGIDLCSALAAVHSAGLLHRDIKAQNVVLADDDGRVVLMDFGTGTQLEDASLSDQAGTPLYLAPELFAGDRPTGQSDLYSLGVLLFHLLTGAYPVAGATIGDLRTAHQQGGRTRLRTRRPDTPARLVRVIERAIDPVPERRYPTAAAMAIELRRLAPRPALIRLAGSAVIAAAIIMSIGFGIEFAGRKLGWSRTPGMLLANAGLWHKPVRATDDVVDIYLRGQALASRRSGPSVQGSLELFEEAIRRDPGFAPAHAGLANAYAFLSLFRGQPFTTVHSKMRAAASTAVDLDPRLAEGHAALGWIHSYDFNWALAEASFRRAIELNPALSQTYTSYAIAALEPLGKLDEAVRILRAALQHEPGSLDVQREIGQAQMLAGHYEEALVTLRAVRAIDPHLPFVEDLIARTLMYSGRLSEALPMMENRDSVVVNAPGRVRRNPWLVLAYVQIGRRAEAESLIDEHAADDSRLAIIYAALGDKDGSFAALERASASEPHRVPRTLMHPEMATLEGDPRLATLRARFKLPPE